MINHCTIGKMYIKDLNIVRCADVNPDWMTFHWYCVYYGHTFCTESNMYALCGSVVVVSIVCALMSQPLKCGVKFPAPQLLKKYKSIEDAESDHGSDLKILIILANHTVILRYLLYIVSSFISLFYLHLFSLEDTFV